MDSYKLKKIIFISIIVIINVILISITASSVIQSVVKQLNAENAGTNVGQAQEPNTNVNDGNDENVIDEIPSDDDSSSGSLDIKQVLDGISWNLETILKTVLFLIGSILLILEILIFYRLK